MLYTTHSTAIQISKIDKHLPLSVSNENLLLTIHILCSLLLYVRLYEHFIIDFFYHEYKFEW